MNSTYCQTTQFRMARSKITGRELVVNESADQFFVSAKADFSKLPKLAEEYLSLLEAQGRKDRTGADTISALELFANVKCVDDFCGAVDTLIVIVRGLERKGKGHKSRAITWLQRLWVEGFCAFPVNIPFDSRTDYPEDEFGLSCNQEWLLSLKKSSTSKSNGNIIGSASRAASTAIGITESGDLCPDGVSSHYAEVFGNNLKHFVTPLLALQKARYPGIEGYTSKDWGMGRKSRGNDRTYGWVIEKHPELSDWQHRIAEWLREGRSLALRTYMADRLFAYLIKYPSLPRTVEAYCRRSVQLEYGWGEWAVSQQWAETSLNHYTNYFADFLDWYIRVHLTAEDDHGRPVASPEHWNPIARKGMLGQATQSHREAMPLRYIHELVRILQANDFAWPKSISSEYFMWSNPETGQFEKVWSPIRTYALLFKLHLPLRTFQVRMLDSGEGDTEVLQGGDWVKNPTPLAPSSRKPVRRGFLRKLNDSSTGTYFTGFYVNTNKTADIYRDAKDMGYEIPWQHEEVIRLAQALLLWQQKYNPISKPFQWANIHDKTVLRSHAKESLKQRGEICFLFRDPKGIHQAEPVVDSRLQIFWVMLLRELERRVAERGDALADGSAIRFVHDMPGSGLPSPLFDLHSLRVSLITAYAIEGGVPIQVLSKCVAGHATVLMTLYYTKPGPAYVSEQLALAQEKIQQAEQSNFLRFLRNTELSQASPLVVTNDASAFSALEHNEQSGWVVGDIGICPVGMGKCEVGGANLRGEKAAKVFGAVPGGAKNCVRCRFFVTGPAFLGGLVAKFNSTGVKLMEASERLRKLEAEICHIEDSQDSELLKGVGRIYDRRDRVLEEVDLLAHNWHAAYSLIQRSKTALSNNGTQGGLNLVLAGDQGDLATALTECVDFDLYNAVCQVATVYPNDGVTLSNLRRGRLLDAMLSRNGRKPVFAALSEDEVLAVGNEFVSLLMARVGRAGTIDLIEGKRMLESTGVVAELDKLLGKRGAPPPLHLHQIEVAVISVEK